MRFIYTLSFLFISAAALAQDEGLFGPVVSPDKRHGFILNGNGSFDLPAADMAKRFGVSYRVGPAVLYKTKSNWLFGAKFDFIIGSKVKEDSLMYNIVDRYSAGKGAAVYEFLNNSGTRIGVPVFERGYAVGVNAGYIFSLDKKHPDNGLEVLTTAGFIQHKINIFSLNRDVNQLEKDYKKGYDRLANGIFLEQYAGYVYFSRSRMVNFTLGVDALFGFTQGRRDYLYDVMRPGNEHRLDILFGLRGGWYIPIFKRKSEELIFE